jgi:acetyl/propionyl-CoA carboxylase alpha subunit
MIKAKVNDKADFEIVLKDNHIKINDKELFPDVQPQSDGSLSMILEGKSYNIRLIQGIEDEKLYTWRVNGSDYRVKLSDEMDILLAKLGLSSLAGKKINEVKAPMPGLVLSVLTSVGQEVKKGDSLLILEAMKMENIIKSPAEGKIKNICVQPQNKVEKNAVLIEFE